MQTKCVLPQLRTFRYPAPTPTPLTSIERVEHLKWPTRRLMESGGLERRLDAIGISKAHQRVRRSRRRGIDRVS
jgi:hypothetical protein